MGFLPLFVSGRGSSPPKREKSALLTLGWPFFLYMLVFRWLHRRVHMSVRGVYVCVVFMSVGMFES